MKKATILPSMLEKEKKVKKKRQRKRVYHTVRLLQHTEPLVLRSTHKAENKHLISPNPPSHVQFWASSATHAPHGVATRSSFSHMPCNIGSIYMGSNLYLYGYTKRYGCGTLSLLSALLSSLSPDRDPFFLLAACQDLAYHLASIGSFSLV